MAGNVFDDFMENLKKGWQYVTGTAPAAAKQGTTPFAQKMEEAADGKSEGSSTPVPNTGFDREYRPE